MPLKIVTKLTQEQIDRFKVLYKKHFGEDITDEHAEEEGLYLINFVSTVLNMEVDRRRRKLIEKNL